MHMTYKRNRNRATNTASSSGSGGATENRPPITAVPASGGNTSNHQSITAQQHPHTHLVVVVVVVLAGEKVGVILLSLLHGDQPLRLRGRQVLVYAVRLVQVSLLALNVCCVWKKPTSKNGTTKNNVTLIGSKHADMTRVDGPQNCVSPAMQPQSKGAVIFEEGTVGCRRTVGSSLEVT